MPDRAEESSSFNISQAEIIQPPIKKNNFFEFETDKTLNLSNAELQRLVLLEQLQVLCLKKEKLLFEKKEKGKI